MASETGECQSLPGSQPLPLGAYPPRSFQILYISRSARGLSHTGAVNPARSPCLLDKLPLSFQDPAQALPLPGNLPQAVSPSLLCVPTAPALYVLGHIIRYVRCLFITKF